MCEPNTLAVLYLVAGTDGTAMSAMGSMLADDMIKVDVGANGRIKRLEHDSYNGACFAFRFYAATQLSHRRIWAAGSSISSTPRLQVVGHST